MAKGLSGSFFDQPSGETDEEGVISGFDPADLQIPLMDEEDTDEEDEEELEEEKPKKKKRQPEPEEEEDDEEEEIEEDDSDDENESDTEDDEISTLNTAALDLIDKGVLLIDEEKAYEDSELGFAEMVEDTVDARIKEKVLPGYESVLSAMELGIPAQEWVANITPVAFEDADLEDEDTQKYLVIESLKLSGLTETQIEKKLKRFIDLDTLADEAEEAQALLIKSEAKRVSEYNKQVQEELRAKKEKQESFIDSINEQIDSMKELNGEYLDRKKQRELKDYINKPVNSKGQTQYMLDRNDPKKLIQIAHLAKNGVNLSKLTKQIESKVTRKVKDSLDSRTDNGTSGKGRQVKEKINSNKMSGGMPWDRTNYDPED